ncbi:MAG: CBS domain-containing protein [Methylocystaceae bacterium]
MEIITSHNSLDFDGLASMVAAGKLYPRAIKVFSGTLSENVKRFSSLYKDLLGIKIPKEINLIAVKKLIVVDTKNPSRLARLKALSATPGLKIHLYDHHPAADDDLAAEFLCDGALGAATTLLVEMIKHADIEITPFEATVMALGIYEDTGSLLFTSTTARDAAAVAFLLEKGANLSVVDRFIDHGLTSAQSRLLQKLLGSCQHHQVQGMDILIALGNEQDYVEGLDVITYRLGELEPADATFTVVTMEGKANVVARGRNSGIKVNDVLAGLGGRGHDKAASAVVKQSTELVAQSILERCQELCRPALLASDIMSSPVKSVNSSMNIEEAGRLMLRYGHTGMPVVENDQMVGIISRRDVDKARIHNLGHAPVKGFMSRNIVSLPPTTPVSEIQRVMVEKDIGRVPIVEAGRVVGIISRTDILRTIHGDSSDIEDYAPLWMAGYERDISEMLISRLPGDIVRSLRMAGAVASEMGFKVYAVGGFVRDLVLKVPNFDVDLVVQGDGIEFAHRLAEEGKGRCREHERFRTAVVIFSDGTKVDIATARTEYYEFPAALPNVEASSIREDLYRRDFTINTMAVCLNPECFGQLLDFFGGWQDIEEGLIRVLYNLSFIEDPTRIIRAIRFEQRYCFRLEKETLRFAGDAINRRLLGELSYRRILNELILVLNEKDPVPALRRMMAIGVWEYVLPEVDIKEEKWVLLRRIPNLLVWLEKRRTTSKYRPWLVYLLVMVKDLPEENLEDILTRYPFDRQAMQCLRASASMAQLAGIINANPAIAFSNLAKAIDTLEPELLIYLLLSLDNEASFQRVVDYILMRRELQPGITGKDLKNWGLKAGPAYQKILNDLWEARLDGLVKSREEEEELAKQWLTEGKYELYTK